MAGSGFGTNFRITTWGETHGAGVGGNFLLMLLPIKTK